MFDVFFTFALLASATVANAYCLKFVPLIIVSGFRMLGAGVILIFLFRKKSPRLNFAYVKQDLLKLFGISLLMMLIPALMKAFALKYMPTSKAAFFGSLDPFVTALYAYFLFNERLNKQKVIGICLGFLGIIILLFTTSPQEQKHIFWWIISYPEIAALLAMAIGRLGWLFVQKLLRNDRYNAPEINGVTMTLSGLATFFSPFIVSAMYFLGNIFGMSNQSPWEFAYSNFIVDFSKISHPMVLIYALIHTMLIGNVIGYTLYGNLLRHHSATLISLAGFSVPIYIYIYDLLRGTESFSFNFVIAAMVTFSGLLIFYRAEIKRLISQEVHVPK
jgi:drug/metabolite transporter (DMT)-like permease